MKVIPRIKRGNLSSISRRSGNIFSIFEKTKIQAENLNAEISKLNEKKKKDAQRILDEVTELEKVYTKNESLAKKIHSFIHD